MKDLVDYLDNPNRPLTGSSKDTDIMELYNDSNYCEKNNFNKIYGDYFDTYDDYKDDNNEPSDLKIVQDWESDQD